MPRRLYALEAKAARLNLAPQRKPQHFTSLADGISIGYRRNQNAPGTWVLKRADGTGGYWTKALGPADDYEAADGSNVLDFRQAQLKALELGRNPNGGTAENTGRPATVAEAVDAYELDLVARGGNPENARRLRRLVPGAILDKAVATLTVAELKRFRDGLAAGGRARSGVNRDMKPLRAALTLAASVDPRISNAAAWTTGLAALPEAHVARNTVLTDAEVRAVVAGAYAEGPEFGLLVELLAVTGARISQACRLEVADLQADRVMMPSSRKGRGKKISRSPVPITDKLAAALRRASAGRPEHEPLLLRADGSSWEDRADMRYGWNRTVKRAGLGPEATPYSLRHSSITRQLKLGTPIRLVAVAHDTSVGQIEANYSARIADHADAILRRGLLDVAEPAANNVVALRALK